MTHKLSTILLHALLAYALTVITGLLLQTMTADVEPHSLGALLRSVSASFLSLSFLAYCFTRGSFASRLRVRRANAPDIALAVIGVLAMSSALDALLDLFSLRDTGGLAQIRGALTGLDALERLGAALILGIGAGTAEELFFRGYLLTRLELARNARFAIVMSALVFGLFHADLVHTPLAIALGAYLAMLVVQTGSLWPAIVSHAVNNMVATFFVDLRYPATVATSVLVLGTLVSAASYIAISKRNASEPARAVW